MTIRLYMSMSLDGFIACPDDRAGQGLGRNGGRLFNWLDERDGPGINGQVYAEALATGAIISGRRTFELAGRWNGDHHDDVPILILTHDPEPPSGNVRVFAEREIVEFVGARRGALSHAPNANAISAVHVKTPADRKLMPLRISTTLNKACRPGHSRRRRSSRCKFRARRRDCPAPDRPSWSATIPRFW